jgi:hypothetical protein
MKDCFGTIYPDLSQFRFGKESVGKVFRLKIDTLGPGHRDRHLETDLVQWRDCMRCEEFRGCYDLSTAKMAMQQAAAAI